MAINITCPGCHTRFKVSDAFAGREGPCPKCKTQIKIPGKSDEVVIHAPEEYEGLKDSSGQSVLKPISRKDTKLSPQVIVGIVGGVLMLLLVAFVVGRACREDGVPVFLLAIGSILLAPPLVFAAYTFLRDDELQPHRGVGLWVRVGICSIVYAALWAVYAFVVWVILPYDDPKVWHLVLIVPLMFVAGAGVANLSLEIEYTSGLFHYGMYLATTVLLRLVMGLPAFGGWFAGS